MQTFQDLILSLSRYWADQGAILQQPYDLEVGAGTMHPDTFLRVLGPEPWRVAFVQPSRRPADARYGDNPFRLGKHYQFQVILKPNPQNIQDLYVRSLEAMGIELAQHDLRFEEDNWEAPTLGAWGVGWQVMLDGMEITQFTYFQQAGGLELAPISAEITYGLERITMFLGLEKNVFDLRWVGGEHPVTYRQVRHQDEVEMSKYYFELADVGFLEQQLAGYEHEAQRCLEAELVIPAYESTLRCSHCFNVLDARGAVSVTERVALIKRVRDLANACARLWVESRERLGWPLLEPGVEPKSGSTSAPESEPESPPDGVTDESAREAAGVADGAR